MAQIIDNISTILPLFLGSWGLFILFTLLRPQRFGNSFLLMAALFFSVFFFAGLFGEYFADALIFCTILAGIAILLVPAMLITNGIFMIKKESRSLGNLLSLILGVIIAVGELLAVIGMCQSTEIISRSPLSGPITFLWVTVFYFSVWILAFVMYIIFIQLMPHRRNYDYIIIHGCGLLGGERVSRLLANRLDKAIELYRKCKRPPVIIPSGGKGEDESISEADAMRGYLIAHGIPEKSILIEDGSMTTMENLRLSMALINERGGKKRTALVSSNYHIYRCILYASKLKFRCTGVGAKVAWYYWPSATLREFAAVFTKKPYIIRIILGYFITVICPTIFLMSK